LAGGRQMKSVWEILPPSREEKHFGKHPTQKPTELLTRILLASSDEDDLVLDPFMGSGTTLVAAKRNNRRAIGIEIEAKYVQTTRSRLGYSNQEALGRSEAMTSETFTLNFSD